MKKLNIIDEDGSLTEESVQAILEHTEVLECACPQHLLQVLKSILDFQEYETNCIINHPKDAEIHTWLLSRSKMAEKLMTETMVELMKKENIVDDELYFCTPPKFSI